MVLTVIMLVSLIPASVFAAKSPLKTISMAPHRR